MRYKEEETTNLVGKLGNQKEVTIKVVHVPSDTLISTLSDKCVESQHISGMYFWSTTNMETTLTGAFIYEMTDGSKVSPGKFTIGGAMEYLTETPTVEDIYEGTWKKII